MGSRTARRRRGATISAEIARYFVEERRHFPAIDVSMRCHGDAIQSHSVLDVRFRIGGRYDRDRRSGHSRYK